jgi:uncharacterized membrane protein required for colicin V production
MSVLFSILLLLVMIACVGFTFTEGLWSNLIRFVNVAAAATIATNYWEPLARQFEAMYKSGTYFWDFTALWLIFAVSVLVLQLVTSQLSQVKVKFLTLADHIGSAVFGTLTGLALLCFLAMTLHTAPLAEKFFGGAFDYTQGICFGMSPDRAWCGYMQTVSDGAFAQSPPSPFDPGNTFMSKYAARRAKIEKLAGEGKPLQDDSPPTR